VFFVIVSNCCNWLDLVEIGSCSVRLQIFPSYTVLYLILIAGSSILQFSIFSRVMERNSLSEGVLNPPCDSNRQRIELVRVVYI